MLGKWGSKWNEMLLGLFLWRKKKVWLKTEMKVKAVELTTNWEPSASSLWLGSLPRGGMRLFKKFIIWKFDGGLYQNYCLGVDRTCVRSGLVFDLGVHCIGFGILHFMDSTAPGLQVKDNNKMLTWLSFAI